MNGTYKATSSSNTTLTSHITPSHGIKYIHKSSRIAKGFSNEKLIELYFVVIHSPSLINFIEKCDKSKLIITENKRMDYFCSYRNVTRVF